MTFFIFPRFLAHTLSPFPGRGFLVLTKAADRLFWQGYKSFSAPVRHHLSKRLLRLSIVQSLSFSEGAKLGLSEAREGLLDWQISQGLSASETTVAKLIRMSPPSDHQRHSISSSSKGHLPSSQTSSYISPSQFPSPPPSESQTTAPSSYSSAATFASSYSQHMAPPLSSPSEQAHHQYPTNPSRANPPQHSQPSRPTQCVDQPGPQQDNPYGTSSTVDQAHFYSASQREQPTNDQTATMPFLRDFNLVAEAAKRAQMAVLMRDMEGVSL